MGNKEDEMNDLISEYDLLERSLEDPLEDHNQIRMEMKEIRMDIQRLKNQ